MFDQILKEIVAREVPEDEVAVLLSGGIDSISVALTAHRMGKKVTAYTFHLEGQESYDSKKATQVAKTFGWDIVDVAVPKTGLVPAWKRLAYKYGCRKKTHFECIYPFLFVLPLIKEKKVLTGWGADGWFGLSKKAQCNEKYRVKKSIEGLNKFRDDYFGMDSVAGHKQLKVVASHYALKLVMPYIEEPTVETFFRSKDWFECSGGKQIGGSSQKSIVRRCFQQEIEQIGTVSPHANLQMCSGINVLFDQLLENTEINFKGRGRLMDVARDWASMNTDVVFA
jgi:asparagine synthetase B (glutamine-hydrolysing)